MRCPERYQARTGASEVVRTSAATQPTLQSSGAPSGCTVHGFKRNKPRTFALSGAERKAAIKDFKTVAIYLRKFSLLSGVAGGNQMLSQS
jgi:hypothetical protein